MLWFLTIVNSAGGLRRLSDVSGGAQEARFVGGAQAISSAIAEELGDRIKLEAPVTRITSSTSSVEVESGGKSIDAQIAIVAMMPGDAERIRFSPELPAQRRELQSRWVASAGAKATVRYSGPFWRDQGLSGTAFSSDHAVGFVIDITPPDQPEGWVAIFLDHLPPGRTPRDVIIEGLTLLFGPRAADPLSVDVHDWSADPWTAGCVSALPPGVLTALGDALRAPVGRIHWAGTETADRWIGYMDGAVRSGQRVASEVLTALHHIRTGGG
jgi:monoamine oxidase